MSILMQHHMMMNIPVDDVEQFNEISVTDFGDNWPYSEYHNMYQCRIIKNSNFTVNSFSFINNQSTVKNYAIISCPSIPEPSDTNGNVEFTIALQNGTGSLTDTPFVNEALGTGFYKHTVTLNTPITLDSNLQYAFIVRSTGSGYVNEKSVALDGIQGATYGCCFGSDLDNRDSSVAGTSWQTWYEVRYSHDLDHPYYLEINGIRS